MILTKLYLLDLSLIWFVTAPCLLYLLQLLYSIMILHRSNSILFYFPSYAQHYNYLASLIPFILCVSSAYSILPHKSPLQIMHCVSSRPHASHSKNNVVFYVLHVFLTSSPLPDHHANSSSSLVIILNLFIIRGRYPKIL
jgi:hypothetical protein